MTLPIAQPLQVMPPWAGVVGLALRGQVNVPTNWLRSWLLLLEDDLVPKVQVGFHGRLALRRVDARAKVIAWLT